MADFKPTPNLVLFFACEDAAVNVSRAERDLQYGWWELKKPLYHVFTSSGVTTGFGTPELCLYYLLTSGRGDYELTVEFRQLDLVTPRRSRTLMWTDPIHVYCEDELAVVEGAVPMTQVPFPQPGQYQFTMRERGNVLPGGDWYLRVFPGEQP